MKRHTSRVYRVRAPKGKRRQPRFRFKVPVTWGAVESAAEDREYQPHATSWRTRLKKSWEGLFASPRWISLLVLLLIGMLIYLVGADSTFVISEVQVDGNVNLSRQALVEASGIDNLHIFWVDPAKAARKVAEIPGVLTATVQIGWPNQAHITVAERTPVLEWDQAGNRFWVDANGLLMQARQQSSGMLVILSQERETLKKGDRLPLEVIEGALQLRRLRPNIESLYFERRTGLSYLDGRNWEAFFGVGADMDKKLVVYETLVEELVARELQPEYISVINKEKPFYRLIP